MFTKPRWVAVLAFTAAVVWGCAYPLIKLGFEELAITSDLTGGKLLFAGIRFAVSGIVVLTVAFALHRPFRLRKSSDLWYLLLYSLLNTTLHYLCFYIGLSHAPGARSAILNSLSVFSVIPLACFFFRSDAMSLRKLLGCILGFAGIMALNLGSTDSGHFTWQGDGMIILNALFGATATLLTRGLGKRVDVFTGTGYSLAIGGFLLVLTGWALGGYIPHPSPLGGVYLLLLVGISTVGFGLYNKLLTCNPVGKVAIYNALIPVVGAVTSCICLAEPFYWKYVLAGSLAASGIYIINKGRE